jgi:hypothetical protein
MANIDFEEDQQDINREDQIYKQLASLLSGTS